MRNAGAHLFCLSSSIVCCEVSQCDFLRLNIFFDLLSVAFIAATKRSHTAPFKKIYCTVRNEVKIKTCLGGKRVSYSSSFVQLLSQDRTVLACVRASIKDRLCCLIL